MNVFDLVVNFVSKFELNKCKEIIIKNFYKNKINNFT